MDYCYVRRVGRLALSSGGTSTPYAPAITSHVNGLAAIVSARFSAATLSATMIAAALFVAVLVTVSSSLRAENAGIKNGRELERTEFTNHEIIDGFFKIAFGAELHVAGKPNRIRKFDGPVRVFLDDRANADRRADIAAVIADIRRHVAHSDVAMTEDRQAANVVVILVRDRNALRRTIRSLYGRERANQIERRLTPRCLSGFGEDGSHRIRRSEVILTADGGDFEFFDCAYEELLQALGPINDDSSVPWSMFNDDVQMGFFDIYDQYLLNILYDPRVRPGMTKEQVRDVFPSILLTVRSWVSQANSLAGAEAAQ